MDISLEGSRVSSGSFSNYRPAYKTAGRGYGRNSVGDEAFDSSINFGDEVSFGNKKRSHGNPASPTHNKSLVDIFIADDNADSLNEFRPVAMQPTEKGNRLKKWLWYLCLGIVFIVIFVTIPKPGFMMGSNTDDSNEDYWDGGDDYLPTNATATALNATEDTMPSLEGATTEEPTSLGGPTSSPTRKETESPQPEELIAEDSGTIELPEEWNMDRPQAIHAYILEKKISTAQELKRLESPAAMALDWIAATDRAEMDVPGNKHNKHNVGTKEEQGIRLLQRYALACFYFAMEETYSEEGRRYLRNLQSQGSEKEEENRLEFDDHWTTKEDVCEWYGVTCNDDKYVTSLNLAQTLLKGRLAPELFQGAALPYLTSLNLGHNSIQGTFPSQAIDNNNLEVLLLEHNQIEGDLDPVLRQLPALVQLDLQANQLSGSLPEDWSLLSNLEALKLASNNLVGTLPPGMGTLTKLEWFQLDSNHLTGSIPTEYATMERLHSFKIARNQVEGTLPEFLGDFRLVHLSLQENRFSGEVPPSLGKLTVLEDLHLHMTDLVGTMPEEVCALLGGDKALNALSADCKEPKVECSCCTVCY